MASTMTAQVNARIDANLKREGDDAFAAAGLTPTQAVRALWELAVNLRDAPDQLRALLFPGEREREDAVREKELMRKLKLAEEGASLMNRTFLKLGIEPPREGESSNLSYDELKELAYRERYVDFFGRQE